MKAIIWGAGDGGLRTFMMLDPAINILAYVDISTEKIGNKLNDIEIIAPQQICNYDFDYVIIGNLYGQEISQQLEEKYNVPGTKIMDVYHNGLIDARIGTLKAISQEINEKNISGSVAELGVYTGEFSKYISLFFDDRKLYLFDTFSGFDSRDVAVERKLALSDAKEKDYFNDNVERVLQKIANRDQCIVRKGFFPETAVGLEDQFCFVSLDVDLYSPTYAGLSYFYDRLSAGGYLMVHDYSSTMFDGVKKAVRQFAKEREVNYVPIMDLDGSVMFCK